MNSVFMSRPPTRRRSAHLDDYRPPKGRLLLAECEGKPAGVGALRMLSDEIAEIKRMYVAPDWRDRHLGSAILDRLLEEARSRRSRIVRLDTCRFMTDAQRLYRSRAFAERPPYEGTEIPTRPCSQTELRGSRHGPERLVDGRKVLVALTEFDRPAQTFVQHSRK